MKTIAVFYERFNGKDLPKIKKLICKTTTEEEHNVINRQYLNDTTIGKALSFCWWVDNEWADEVYKKYQDKMNINN